MSTERDIIIERLEQKLDDRDKQILEMQDSLKESVLAEVEKQFEEKIKLREATLEDVRMKFSEKVAEITEMNKSLRDSLLGQVNAVEDTIQKTENRMNRIERRLVELNSSYDGVMKELLDQKSIVQEITGVNDEDEDVPEVKEEVKPAEISDEQKESDKPDKKGEYIIAENYVPKKGKKQAIIDADDIIPEPDEKAGKVEQAPEPVFNTTENEDEGVIITETLKKR